MFIYIAILQRNHWSVQKNMIRLLKNKEFRNAGWLIGGRIIQMSLSLIVGILTARYLGPSNYGLINYGAAYVAFFTSFCTLGINSIIIKNFVDKHTEQGETIGTALVLRIIASILSSIMIITVVNIIDYGEKDTILVTSLCSIALVFQVFDTINYWFQYRYQSKITSIATLLAYIIVSIYKIILLFTNKSIIWFALASSIDYIVIALFLYFSYKYNCGPKLAFSKSKAKELLGSSYHYIISGMMVAIYNQTDKLMLKQMLGQVDVGFYSAASTICNMWVFVLSAIIDSIVPTIMSLYEKNQEAFERKNKQLYSIVFYVSVSVSIFFLLFGKNIILILYGDEYILATNPLKIITWYTAFSYLGVARNAWIVCENKQKYLKYIYLGAVIINIILNFVLIPILGASGAALASLITQIFTSIILPCFIRELQPNVKLMIDAILLRYK